MRVSGVSAGKITASRGLFAALLAGALSGVLFGCAGVRHVTQAECPTEMAHARGLKDGGAGKKANISFLRSCTAETRALAVAAYREGYAFTRAKHKVGKEDSALEVADVADEEEDSAGTEEEASAPLTMPTPVREPSAVSWVCEVEAESKIFTGIGSTRDEAFASARSTCGSHFQASYCTKADCRQNM